MTGAPENARFRAFRAAVRMPEDVHDDQVALLLAVSLALLFEEYDLAMLTSALHLIAGDLGMAETTLPYSLGLIRLGAAPAFFLVPYADRIGRRRIFLISLASMGLLTFATALSQTAWQFVLLQMLTRTFFVAGSAVAFVFVSEEFPAHRRGFGIGMLGALAATGHGLGAALFSMVHRLPHGWRDLYLE